MVEVLQRLLGIGLAVEARHDLLRQQHLAVARIAARRDFLLHQVDLGQRAERQQRVVLPHQVVRDAHQLAEHLVGRLGHADVVALGLGHLLDAVQAHQQRHGQDALRLLAVFLLQLAPDQQVELLVGAAELQV
ncbi:hypothetical protein D9M72_402680 [compost metagenome]